MNVSRPLFLALGAVCAQGAFAFEKIAWLDQPDFADALDTEAPSGIVQMAEHVLLTGATEVWVREKSGMVPRFHSKVADCDDSVLPFDKRRLPRAFSRNFAFARYQQRDPDPMTVLYDALAARGVGRGVHHCIEDSHGCHMFVSEFNFEHPQYWCKGTNGVPWEGHCSFAFPEVVAHRVAIIREMLERGAKTVMVDYLRDGWYGPRHEYVQPMVAKWKALYGEDEPLPDYRDGRWTALVAELHRNFLRQVRDACHAAPQKARLILGVTGVGNNSPDGKHTWSYTYKGVDWRELLADGTVDGLAVITTYPTKRGPEMWKEVESIYRRIIAEASGKPVFFPIRRYDFGPGNPGLYNFSQWSGDTAADCIRKLLRLAADVGGAGITMECVDYENYTPEFRKIIREFQP